MKKKKRENTLLKRDLPPLISFWEKAIRGSVEPINNSRDEQFLFDVGPGCTLQHV